MIGRPQISTLFPNTTLSRSRTKIATSHKGRKGCRRARHIPAPSTARLPARLRGRLGGARKSPSAAARRPGEDQPDRKSTRLNSSHLVISYAVFCLKKNKQVSPPVFLNYLEEGAIQASAEKGYTYQWYNENKRVWFVRKATIRYFELVTYGEELELRTWVSDSRRVQSHREYDLRLFFYKAPVARGLPPFPPTHPSPM